MPTDAPAARPPTHLLALDLDGSLLRDDGCVDPRDRAAIARARARGVEVTLATGRLTSTSLPIARELDLALPIVCIDGAVVACARTGRALAREVLAAELVDALLDALAAAALAPVLFTDHEAHCDAADVDGYAAYVADWATLVRSHPSLNAAARARGAGGVTFAIAVGPREAAQASRVRVAARWGAHVDADDFALGVGADPPWALRVRPRGCTKAAGLARVAARAGVARERVAVLGDWYNDLPMFAWAGRSFAMGQSPHAVRSAATDVLAATSTSGGAIAELLARWPGDGGARGRAGVDADDDDDDEEE